MIPVDPASSDQPSPNPSTRPLQSPGSELPAPYANPWGLLVQDLRAVLADLRLQAVRLWRQNRQGELPRPGLWPRDLAPLFWPLAIALLIALVLALVMALPVGRSPLGLAGGDGAASPQPSRPEPEDVLPPPATEPTPALSGAEGQSDPPPTTPSVDSSLLEAPPVTHQPKPSSEQQAQTDLATALTAALAAQGNGQWIEEESLDPTGSLLRLQLNAGFTTLPAGQQRKLAEAWQALAQGFGCDRLELVDRQGHVLGRQALVGSGMILLSPQHLS